MCEFSSRDVSNRLGLDFLNTAKKLSRMAHAPYNLLSCRRMPRPYGGYENSYKISNHGWSRVNYLQPAPTMKPVEEGGSMFLRASRARVEYDYRYPFLLTSTGTRDEYTLLGIPSEVMWKGTPLGKTHPANFGAILTGLKPEVLAVWFDSSMLQALGTENQLPALLISCLQKLGLAPSNILASAYANGAIYLGATIEEIVISALGRRCIELNKRVASKDFELSSKEMDLSHREREATAIRLKSSLEEVGWSRVESSLRDEILRGLNFLHELFIKIHQLSSLTTDRYARSQIDKIQFAIMEYELSFLKRRHRTAT
jgi:hypothetical protein